MLSLWWLRLQTIEMNACVRSLRLVNPSHGSPSKYLRSTILLPAEEFGHGAVYRNRHIPWGSHGSPSRFRRGTILNSHGPHKENGIQISAPGDHSREPFSSMPKTRPESAVPQLHQRAMSTSTIGPCLPFDPSPQPRFLLTVTRLGAPELFFSSPHVGSSPRIPSPLFTLETAASQDRAYPPLSRGFYVNGRPISVSWKCTYGLLLCSPTYKNLGRRWERQPVTSMHSHSQPHSQASAAPVPAPKRPQHQRRRTLSNTVSISPTGSAPKITLAAQTSTSTSTSAARSAASGAFTLTGCARAALRGLATGTYDDESDSYTDSYTDSDDQYTPRHARTRSNYSDKDVPSISRTASPFEERQSVPPGWGARPRGTGKSQKRERSQHREQSQRPRIHAVLESVERGSRVGTGRVVCAACAKPGVNFPRCTRCSKMWCSRACRTAAVHRCPPRRSQTG